MIKKGIFLSKVVLLHETTKTHPGRWQQKETLI